MMPLMFRNFVFGFTESLQVIVFVSFIVSGSVYVSQGRHLLQQGIEMDRPVEYRAWHPILPPPLQIKTCASCGATIPLEARFCPQCNFKQDEGIATLSAALPEANSKTVKMLLELSIKTLEDLAGEDPTELSIILDVPVENVRRWINRARAEKKG